MKFFILPYSKASKSAKLLASSLNCKRIKLVGSRYQPSADKLIINWGMSNDHPRVPNSNILNHYEAVERSVNKIRSLQVLTLAGVSTLEYTTDQTTAQSWVASDQPTYCRNLVSSSGGRGINIVSSGIIVDAPLYTKSFPTKHEYRVHVFRGTIIDITQKKRRSGVEVNNQIRNHDNGWVFCRNDIAPLSEENQQVAIQGIQALGLDFGAIDLLVDRNGRAVICECNSAPGIENTTLEKYTQAFKNYLLEY
jgi:hypothetical protein